LQWLRIQREVKALGGKLIAVGAPDQLQTVSDLPGWTIAEGTAGHSTVMDTVLRQNDLMDREATEALARGGEGVGARLRYDMKKGVIKLNPEVRADPVGAIARDYWQGPASERRIVVAATKRDVAQLNDAIRAEGLARAGWAHPGGQDFSLDPATVRRYGIIARFLPGVNGRKDRVEVSLELGIGERVILTEAHGDPDLPRSSLGTVVATRKTEIDVQFDGRDAPPCKVRCD